MANYLRGLELAKQQKYAEADRTFDRISPAFPSVLGRLLSAGSDEIGARAICSSRERSWPNISPCARRHASGAPDRRARRLQPAGPGPSNRISEAVGREELPADAAALTLARQCLYGRPQAGPGAAAVRERRGELDPENPTIKTRVGISEIDPGQGNRASPRLRTGVRNRVRRGRRRTDIGVERVARRTARQGRRCRRLR